MLTFVAAVFLLIATPGPGVLSVAGVGAAYGFRGGLRYVLGLFIGSLLVTLAIITGVAAVVLSIPALRIVLMVASLGYLVYLAARIAFAGGKLAFVQARSAPGIREGVLLQPINPKAYVVITALFTGFSYAPGNLIFETTSKLILFNLIWIPLHLGWLYAGSLLHRLELPEHIHRRINYAMAAAMLIVVALAVFSTKGLT